MRTKKPNMDHYTIYHNPRCSKSREALKLLQEKGIEPEIRLYLAEVPTVAEMKRLLQQLQMQPSELLRRNERIFKEKFKSLDLNEDEWLDIMLEHPKLIERPIVVRNHKAMVGRPPERILELL